MDSRKDNQEAHEWLSRYLLDVILHRNSGAQEAEAYVTGRSILAEPLPVRWEILKATAQRIKWNTHSTGSRKEDRTPTSVLYVATLNALVRAILIVSEEVLAPDDYEMDPDDPLVEIHRLLNRYLIEAWFENPKWGFDPKTCPTGAQILKSKPEFQAQVFRACVERFAKLAKSPYPPTRVEMRYPLSNLQEHLLRRQLSFQREDMLAILALAKPSNYYLDWLYPFMKWVEKHITEQGGIYSELRPLLERVRAGFAEFPSREAQNMTERLDEWLGKLQAGMMAPGEPWADVALAEIAAMETTSQSAWKALLAHAQIEAGGKPNAKWIAEAEKRLATLGEAEFLRSVPDLFALTLQKPTEPFQDRNAAFLKGLACFCSLLDDVALTRSVGTLAETAYKKLASGQLRGERVGNACVYALGLMPGREPIAQLARLQLRVKAKQSLHLINKALDAAAQKSGLTREELEELIVPTYRLDADGVLKETFGDFIAEMALTGPDAREWRWLNVQGKPQKSIPAEIKRDHADAWKALKQAGDEMLKMLPAQRDRIERLLLLPRTWTLAVWRERYLEHPLLLNFTRRLIWQFETGDRVQLALWQDGRMADVMGQPLEGCTEETQVSLWHPVQSDAETVLQWRQWLETQRIVQPFKQAHREIYLLTDAEIATRTYSNRFAAHVIRQPQFNALCSQRGWQYKLQMIHDNQYDKRARLALPPWRLTAEFWTDPIGNNYETDTTGAGSWHYLSTDQVRFCNPEGRPLPLSEIPLQVFSEVMRDVDLFVAVSSVGADPNWMNRGTDRAHDQYWHNYSFGELTASALTRRDLLQRLLPRLKIASRCTLEGKFLTVKGDIRTYKIHLGSGNILMEPNDQYLCIVPNRSITPKGDADNVFLPFEGDATLSVILSKAFLLAADTRITDPTITRQIGTGRQ